jgi:pimeloyl-ACP methyl ester carboxylesterase
VHRAATTLATAVAAMGATMVVTVASGAPAVGARTDAAVTAVAPPSSTLSWSACGKGFECATLLVPADYRNANGDHIPLALARKPATDPAARIGSLLVNFGGPGDAGTETLRNFVPTVSSEIKRRFDLVSFDPRGVGASAAVACVDDATLDALRLVDPTPNSPDDLRQFYDGTNRPVDQTQACIDKYGLRLTQLGSRNVARDVDAIRVALGERKLTFLGFSYGSVIGALYAQLFPDNIRAMAIDGPVDLSIGPQEELITGAAAFEHALDAFLADCAKRSACRFHQNGHPAASLSVLQRRFEDGLMLPTHAANGSPQSRQAGADAFYTAMIAALYDRSSGWPALAAGLALAATGDGSVLQALADLYDGRHDDGTYSNLAQVIDVILCDDRHDARSSFDDYVANFRTLSARYPFFGALFGASPIGCDPRLPAPAPEDTVGDVRARPSKPVLVVGTTHDPATPYSGAKDFARRLRGSRLLTFANTEHGAYGHSACIDHAVDAYLVRGALPKIGTRCT